MSELNPPLSQQDVSTDVLKGIKQELPTGSKHLHCDRGRLCWSGHLIRSTDV